MMNLITQWLTTLGTWLSDLQTLSSLDLLGGLLAGALVFALLTWPRRRRRIGRAHLTPLKPTTVTMADIFLVRLATFLFRPWLVQLEHWYRPERRIQQRHRLLWAGMEQVSLGAWVALHLVTAGLGVLAAALVLLLLAVEPVTSVVIVLLAGISYGLLPELWVRQRTQLRDRVMEGQLVPWLRAIASQLRGSAPLVDAVRLSTETLQRGNPARLPPGLTDLYAEASRMGESMDQGKVATDALATMAERCHQTDVRGVLLAMRRALILGSPLAETLLHQATTAQNHIRARRLRALSRRLVIVTGLTVVAAFLLYVGTIGGLLIVGIIQGFSQLH